MRKTAEELTLQEAVHQIYYGANCRICQEVRRIDLAKLAEELGPDILVGDIRTRLRCRKCGQKRVISTTLWKDNTMSDRMTVHWLPPL